MPPGSLALKGHDCGHRRFCGVRWKGFLLTALVLAGCSIDRFRLLSAPPAHPQEDAAATLSRSFRCPEELTSNDAKQAALQEFMQSYTNRFPNNTVRDMMLFRYRLLVAHSCLQTLSLMLMHVSPVTEMLRVGEGDFGPKTVEFDRKTKVWTVWFRKDGQPPPLSEANLIFNFYGWKPATSAEAIANAFVHPREDLLVLGKFQAPDDVTKAPAYFIVSEGLYPEETYGWVNISKITSVGTGAYTVTFAKKITGTAVADISEKGKAWFVSQEGKAISGAVGQVGVDPGWKQYFAQAHK